VHRLNLIGKSPSQLLDAADITLIIRTTGSTGLNCPRLKNADAAINIIYRVLYF